MRDTYQRQIQAVLSDLVDMTGQVRVALAEATRSLVEVDARRAEAVIDGDRAIDDARARIDEESFDMLARQSPVASDLRVLVATLRMVADLERMGDLSVHVAEVARRRYPTPAVPRRLLPTVELMASTADRMIAQAGRIVASRDVEAARALDERDDDMDSLHRSMFHVLLDSPREALELPIETAVDIALLGRYYERVGDHAVSIGRRLVFIVTGELLVT